MYRLALVLLALNWCSPVTAQHYDTALLYGGDIHGAQAMECTPVLGVLLCDVYHPYGNPYAMWCDDTVCEYNPP